MMLKMWSFQLWPGPSLPPSIISKNSSRTLSPHLTEEEINKYRSNEPFDRSIYLDLENIYGRKFRHTFFYSVLMLMAHTMYILKI